VNPDGAELKANNDPDYKLTNGARFLLLAPVKDQDQDQAQEQAQEATDELSHHYRLAS
jgi:hypothetical protein